VRKLGECSGTDPKGLVRSHVRPRFRVHETFSGCSSSTSAKIGESPQAKGLRAAKKPSVARRSPMSVRGPF